MIRQFYTLRMAAILRMGTICSDTDFWMFFKGRPMRYTPSGHDILEYYSLKYLYYFFGADLRTKKTIDIRRVSK